MNTSSTGAKRPAHKGEDTIHLLQVDEHLAAAIPKEDRALAAHNLVVPAMRLEPGRAVRLENDPGRGGMLLVDGFMTRDVEYAGQRSRELLGTGDLLRPWDLERDYHPPFSDAGFTVMEPTTLALLDDHFLRFGARWPMLVDELLQRATQRSRWLAIRLAIGGLTRIDERVLLFLWHAAGRWGQVTPDGIALRFCLTHEAIGELIGAERPSVTTAVSRLRREGRLICRRERAGTAFILVGDPPAGRTRNPARQNDEGAAHRRPLT